MPAKRRKTRTHVPVAEDAIAVSPRSFVVKSGDVGKTVGHLVRDMRRVMAPNTALKLRERSSNKLKDYISLSGPLHVSHLMLFSRSRGLNLRIAKLPRGPTLGFRINEYCLSGDIAAALKNPKTQSGALFQSAPLVRYQVPCGSIASSGMRF
jgi:ribosome biogenesis protein SSF1/2